MNCLHIHSIGKVDLGVDFSLEEVRAEVFTVPSSEERTIECITLRTTVIHGLMHPGAEGEGTLIAVTPEMPEIEYTDVY